MERSPCCEKNGLKKGPWTPEEDQKLLAYIEQHGHGCWRALPTKAGLQRCGKSCRLRWTNYLRPDIKRGGFSLVEEQTIIRLHALLGNRWSAIAAHLPKRTDNEIKNYWNCHLKKRLAKIGVDPATHRPRRFDAAPGPGRTNGGGGGGGASGNGGAAPVGTQQHGQQPAARRLSSHTAQWESTRLEAEARERQASQLRALAASASASVSVLPQIKPRPAAAHRLYSPTTSALSFVPQSAALASVVREDAHLQQQRWGDHVVDVADADIAAAAFAGMLLDESLHQQQTEVEKKYWVGIMNLVNSSSSASSSFQTSVAMPAPEAPTLQVLQRWTDF